MQWRTSWLSYYRSTVLTGSLEMERVLDVGRSIRFFGWFFGMGRAVILPLCGAMQGQPGEGLSLCES